MIPTFRRPHTLPEAIGSALAQEGVDGEVVVVDDDPQRSAEPVVQALREPRVRYVPMESTSQARPAKVRNVGLAIASASLVHFLDDDDRVSPGAYAALASALDGDPRASMAFGTVEPFGGDAAALQHERDYFARGTRMLRLVGRPGLRPFLLASLLYTQAPLVCSAALFRRDHLLALHGFNPAIAVCEDIDLFVRAARRSGARFVDRAVLQYRVGAPSLAHGHRSAALASSDYREIQRVYRETHGALEALSLKLIARTALRFA
ncbi:MAG: glycosyltransferase family 2 protein [Myxococcales bacterium]